MNYTLQISHTKSSFQSRTLVNNSFLPYRTPLNCQPSTNWIALIVFLITTLHRKHHFQQYSVVVGVFTDPLPRNGLHNPFYCCILWVLPSNGCCLQPPLSNRPIRHNTKGMSLPVQDYPASEFPSSESGLIISQLFLTTIKPRYCKCLFLCLLVLFSKQVFLSCIIPRKNVKNEWDTTLP
jgi:hypothetical protein